MARDRVFFKRAAVIHPRYGTPAAAIVVQALWSAGLVLTGSFNSLFTNTGFAVGSSRALPESRSLYCVGDVPTIVVPSGRGAIR